MKYVRLKCNYIRKVCAGKNENFPYISGFNIKMQVGVAIISSMLIILLAIIPNVSLRPAAESTVTEATIKLRKRPTVADVRHSIHELEQIERYYQQLLIRGFLPESDVHRLELLQEFIEGLKTRLETLLNSEDHS